MSEAGATTVLASQLAASYYGGAWPSDGRGVALRFFVAKKFVQTTKITKISCLGNLAPYGKQLHETHLHGTTTGSGFES